MGCGVLVGETTGDGVENGEGGEDDGVGEFGKGFVVDAF
jgi:hypothetical protein